MNDVSRSESRRWTLAINEHGSVVGQWQPGCEVVEVMPVAEHEAIVANLKREINLPAAREGLTLDLED